MKKFTHLIIIIMLISETPAQHKSITLYFPNDSTKVLGLSGLDSMSIFICGASKVRYAGKDYNTVLIGDQCWLKENLDIGIRISHGQWPGNDQTIEKYCYNDLPANCETYGGLYLWDEAMQYVNTEGAKGICPNGWHMPTEAEVQNLIAYAGNNGNALKREDQGTGSGQGTNTSGFSFLLAGGKEYSGGYYSQLGDVGRIYIGKLGSCGYSCVYSFEVYGNNSTILLTGGAMPSWGMSVRCIKDN
jgi:uncharacterized protein (TIGR02145 family)